MHCTRDPGEARDERIVIRSHQRRRRERFGVHAGDTRDYQADAPLREVPVKVYEKIRYRAFACGCILKRR
jgi:hypothetical protein